MIPSPNGGPEDSLIAIAVVSANDIWAVGGASSGGAGQTLTEHWNGTQWSVVSSPNVGTGNNSLSGVAAISANDVWAVGSYYDSTLNQNRSLTEHWNGTTWSVMSSPNVGTGFNELYRVMALSTSDVWAVGSYEGAPGNQTLIEHWDGTTWGVAFSPNLGSYNNALFGVAGVRQSWLWAVGYYSIGPSGSISQTLTEYFLDRDFYSSSGGAPPLAGAGRAPAHMRYYPPRR